MTDDERAQILKMIEAGTVSPEEGLKLMQALDATPPDDDETIELVVPVESAGSRPGPEPNPDFARRIERFRRLWTLPLWIGVLITVGGAFLMYQVMRASGLNIWFYCSWIPFMLGVVVVALAFASRSSRWFYLDVEQPEGQSPRHIAFGFPLPLELLRWGMRNFGHFVPDDARVHTDNVMKAIFEGSASGDPFFVDVREDDGEHVQIYIG